MEAILMTDYVDWKNVPVVLDTKQVADLLNVHINTIKGLVKSNALPSFTIGRARRFHKRDVMRYVGLNPLDYDVKGEG